MRHRSTTGGPGHAGLETGALHQLGPHPLHLRVQQSHGEGPEDPGEISAENEECEASSAVPEISGEKIRVVES